MSYDIGDDYISSDEVQERLQELKNTRDDEELFVVVRVRSGEEITRWGSEEAAREYIDEEDYDPERVMVKEDESEVDLEELARLDRINDWGESSFDDWGDVTVRLDSTIDADYAKQNAIDTGQIGYRADLDSFPYSFIDWDGAADYLLGNAEQASIKDKNGYAYVYVYI